MKLSQRERKALLEGAEDWHIRPFRVYKKMLTEEEWGEYQKRLYPFMRLLVSTKSATKEEAKWEMLGVFLKKKIEKGEL